MKRIFYFTDVLPLLSRGEDAIDKIERNLKIFHDAADSIRLVWHPWSGMDKYLELNNSIIKEKYDRIVKEYADEGWGDLDTSASFNDAREVLMSCDAYYGDVGDLAYEAQNANMPVMLQNIDV